MLFAVSFLLLQCMTKLLLERRRLQGPSLYSGVFCSVAMHGRRRSWTCLVALALCALGVGRSFAGGSLRLRTARTCLEQGPPQDSRDELGDRKLAFGKFRGKSFREVSANSHYVRWCKEKLSRENPLYRDFLDYVAHKESVTVRSSSKAQPPSVEAPRGRAPCLQTTRPRTRA